MKFQRLHGPVGNAINSLNTYTFPCDFDIGIQIAIKVPP